jgi:hypothetical protein
MSTVAVGFPEEDKKLVFIFDDGKLLTIDEFLKNIQKAKN